VVYRGPFASHADAARAAGAGTYARQLAP
jgi:hypothetical protein